MFDDDDIYKTTNTAVSWVVTFAFTAIAVIAIAAIAALT